jgi:AcrR family transcriptional regulator
VKARQGAVGRPRDPELDRRIVEAALDQFAEVGWAGFSMEAVARRAGVGKASLYSRWSSKEALLTDAVTGLLSRVADVDTGTLRDDLVELATQILNIYAGHNSRAMLRLELEASAIPGLAEPYEALGRSRNRAARAIVRRGIARGELDQSTPITLLLDMLVGGAMMHVLGTPPERLAELTRDTRAHAERLVDFLLDSGSRVST